MLNTRLVVGVFVFVAVLVTAQQQCYYAAGAEHRGPSSLVPCNSTGQSTCCLQGDTCMSGNACYNYTTGNLYQYGCTDIDYADETCPYKCGYDPSKSPWTALEYCNDLPQVDNTWICHAPESCGCEWEWSDSLLVLEARGCSAMGSDARVAIYAPSTLAPYVSLPWERGGSTGYYSTTVVSGTLTWVSTAIAGYTPATFTQFTTYRDAPTTPVILEPNVTPGPSTWAAAKTYASSASQSLGDGTASATAFTTSTTSIASSTSATSSTATPTPTSSPAAQSEGLSTGAKAGIGGGVGGGVLLLLAVGLAAYLWGRHKPARETAQHPGHGNEMQQSAAPSYYPQSPPLAQAAPPYQQQSGNWSPYPIHQQQQQYFDQGYDPASAGISPHNKQDHVSLAELSTDADRRPHEIGSEEMNVARPSWPGRHPEGMF